MMGNVGQTLNALQSSHWHRTDTARLVESAYALYRKSVDDAPTARDEKGWLMLMEDILVDTLKSIRKRDATYERIVALAEALTLTRQRIDRIEAAETS